MQAVSAVVRYIDDKTLLAEPLAQIARGFWFVFDNQYSHLSTNIDKSLLY